MTFRNPFRKSNPGRALAQIGGRIARERARIRREQARAFVRAKAREMREQLGLEPDARLAG
jgi:hypothetical protein